MSTARTPAASRKPEGESGKRDLPDWDKLTFSFMETDVMYRSYGELGREPVWDSGAFLPFGSVTLSPAAAFVSYGIGAFEGLKAQKSKDGRVLLFRHRDNARRFQGSAERLCMAPFPEDQFVGAVEGVVRANMRFVPPCGKGFFYVRPVQHAIEPKLGLGPCTKFWVLIFGCPVGSYFASKKGHSPTKGLRLRILEQGRCAPGGTGSAKVMGNYAGGIPIAYRWKEEGYDDVLYLDARHVKHITETSGSNVFVKLKGGPLVTPPLDDQILPGVTRDSTMRVAREILGVELEERALPIDEVLENGEEIFCTGTAWTVQSIGELVYREKPYLFKKSELQKAILSEIRGIQLGEKEDRFGWVTEVQDEE